MHVGKLLTCVPTTHAIRGSKLHRKSTNLHRECRELWGRAKMKHLFSHFSYFFWTEKMPEGHFTVWCYYPGPVPHTFGEKRGIEVSRNPHLPLESRAQLKIHDGFPLNPSLPSPVAARISLVTPPLFSPPCFICLVPLPPRLGVVSCLLRPSSSLAGQLSWISALLLFLARALFRNTGKGQQWWLWQETARDQSRVRITGEACGN